MAEKEAEAASAAASSPENDTPAIEDNSQSAMQASNDVDQVDSPKPDGADKIATPSIEDNSAAETPAGEEEDDEVPEYDDDKGGLFGEGSDEDETPSVIRTLDSGDDEDRQDQLDEKENDEPETDEIAEKRLMEVTLSPTVTPKGSDGQTYLLKLPPFIGLEPNAFDEETFEPPMADDYSREAGFSARAAALNTIRWRHSPADPSHIQSNARIVKWTDRSMTLQLAGNPEIHYELDVKPLAAPTHDEHENPVRYDPKKDSHTYLAAPMESSQMLRITNHITGAITVTPSAQANAETLARLQQSMISRRPVAVASNNRNMITVTEDPELAKRKAEQAEKERERQQRKMQNTLAREMERSSRPLARSGLSQGNAGLSIGSLEGSAAGGLLSKGKKARRAKPAPRRAARSRYSDDEDEEPRYRTKEDEYDKTDDFLADSDEEEDAEFEDDDEDDDLEVGEGSEEEVVEEEKKTKGKLDREKTSAKAASSPKRKANGDDKEEAAGGPGARGKRRRVIVDDDEE